MAGAEIEENRIDVFRQPDVRVSVENVSGLRLLEEAVPGQLMPEQGRLVARSSRGGLDLRELAGPIEAVTERGGVYASFVGDPSGRIETSRGSVEVLMPEDAGAQLDAISRRGSVEIDDDFRVPGDQSEDRVTGPLNGGGSPLRVFTARGTVNVRAR